VDRAKSDNLHLIGDWCRSRAKDRAESCITLPRGGVETRDLGSGPVTQISVGEGGTIRGLWSRSSHSLRPRKGSVIKWRTRGVKDWSAHDHRKPSRSPPPQGGEGNSIDQWVHPIPRRVDRFAQICYKTEKENMRETKSDEGGEIGVAWGSINHGRAG